MSDMDAASLFDLGDIVIIHVVPRLQKPARFIKCVGCCISTFDLDRLLEEVLRDRQTRLASLLFS